MDNSFATGYALGADNAEGRCCNNGGWGMDGGWNWIWIILLFAIFGWGGNGGWGNNGNGALTRADLCQDMNFSQLESGVRGVQQGLCTGFNGVTNSITQSRFDNQQCCCETQRLIERGFCDTNYGAATNTANIIQNAHNDTDRVIAKLNDMEATRQQEKIEALRLENQTLRFQASQTAQNGYIDAIGNSIVARLQQPQPIPAYEVPAPYPYCVRNSGCNSCC